MAYAKPYCGKEVDVSRRRLENRLEDRRVTVEGRGDWRARKGPDSVEVWIH